MRRLNPAERREAAGRVARGESLREVADRFEVSHTTIARLVKDGAPPAPAPVAPAGDLVGDLRRLAADLDFDPDRAGLVQRAIDALTAAAEDDGGPDPFGDLPSDLSPAELGAELLGRLRAAHRRSEAAGDVRGAGYAARTIASLLPAVARLARAAQEDGDVVRISRAELAEAAAAYRQRVAAIVARPLTCARCGAVLRAELAGVELAPAPAGSQ